MPSWPPGSNYTEQLADAIAAGFSSKVQRAPRGLSQKEERLLQLLKSGAGEPVSAAEILAAVFPDAKPGSNPAAVYIAYLRRKLGTEKIRTVTGRGYVWTEDAGVGA